MATSSVTSPTGTTLASAPAGTNPKGILGKDDFLKLLLLELKYQDPTSPMDTEKILAQTSQLATLESTENTNKALSSLSSALTASMQYSSISAIGKMADTGSNAVVYDEGSNVDFELYFPTNINGGDINILDNNGHILRTMKVGATNAGVAKYTWDGKDNTGTTVKEGVYYVESPYTAANGTQGTTRLGLYPIDSIKFDNGTAYAKLGSNYVDFNTIKEITK